MTVFLLENHVDIVVCHSVTVYNSPIWRTNPRFRLVFCFGDTCASVIMSPPETALFSVASLGAFWKQSGILCESLNLEHFLQMLLSWLVWCVDGATFVVNFHGWVISLFYRKNRKSLERLGTTWKLHQLEWWVNWDGVLVYIVLNHCIFKILHSWLPMNASSIFWVLKVVENIGTFS